MKKEILLSCLIMMAFLPACKKNDKGRELPEGSVNLSELFTKHDYYLPFAIVNDTDNISSAFLNNDPVDFSSGSFIDFGENGFYELVLTHTDEKQPNDTFVFTTTTPEREYSEWGIRAWVPAHYKTQGPGTGNIDVYYPHRFADSINVPFIFYVRESGTVRPVYCEGEYTASGDTFRIKRGVGSVLISASALTGQADFIAGGKTVTAPITRIAEPAREMHGTISSETVIAANSFVRITGNLEIAPTGSLRIGEGSVILVDEAVDINLGGPVFISGTPQNPVLITCSRKNKFWGGFITRVPAGTIEAQYTIFCQSGFHDGEGYNWGHSGRQALFYTENSSLRLDNCFITDHIGQIFFPQNSTLILDNILVQRAQTGGQVNTSDLTLRNSVFTDFPVESDVFADNDNDALYLSETDAEISNTTFMYAKDDGLDSGNEGGGVINLTDCRFEACFHEGAALSSGNNVIKTHVFTGCTFTNCGQGLELGFSSPGHTVVADGCQFLKNGVGIRYGDNYSWSDVEGIMTIRNSFSLYNDRDVWNMVRMNWSPMLGNLRFENTFVSEFCPQYPELEIISE